MAKITISGPASTVRAVGPLDPLGGRERQDRGMFLLFRLRRLPAQAVDHDPDDRDVHHENGQLSEAKPLREFKSFKRDEGGGRDEREVLRPLPPEQETGTLGDENSSEAKGGDAELKELFVGDEIEGIEEGRDVAILEVDPNFAHPDGRDFIDILVEKGEEPQGKGNEEQPFDQLEDTDPVKASAVFGWGETTRGHGCA